MKNLPLNFIAAFLVTGMFFVIYPEVDIWISSLFYQPADDFYLRKQVLIDLVYEGIPVFSWIVFLALLGSFLGTFRKPVIFGLNRRAFLFLLLTMFSGPGLLTMAFKDNWHRARPHQIEQFGGELQFSRAFEISDQCDVNCSFYSGHPTSIYFLIAFAMLLKNRKQKIVAALSLSGGFLVGMVRVIQGGHFFSDIIISGFMITATAYLMYWLFYHHLPFCGQPASSPTTSGRP